MKLHRINALLLKYYYITINRVDRLFDIIYWPILDLFIWGFTALFIQKLSDVNVMSMLLGAVILWVFVWRASQDIAVFVLEDFWSRNLYHLVYISCKIKRAFSLNNHNRIFKGIGYIYIDVAGRNYFLFIQYTDYITFADSIFSIPPDYFWLGYWIVRCCIHLQVWAENTGACVERDIFDIAFCMHILPIVCAA